MTAPAAARKNKWGSRVYPVPYPDTDDVVELPAVSRILDQLAAPAIDTWKQKTIAETFSHRPDLVMLAASDAFGAAKQALDSSNAKSNIGTAVHHMTEQIDAGTLMDDMVPKPAWPYVLQYRKAKEYYKWEVVQQEVSVFNHKLGYAGTLDRLLRFPEGIRTVDGVIEEPGSLIGDIKTGKAVYANQALQLFFYSMGEGIWDAPGDDQLVEFIAATAALNKDIKAGTNIPEGRRKWSEEAVKIARAELDEARWREYARLGNVIPMPDDIRHDKGYILHLSETGFELVPMDLTGAEGVVAGLCALFHWNARHDVVGTAFTIPPPPPPIDPSLLDWVGILRTRANALTPELKVQLKAGWPQGVPQLKTGPFYADDVGRLALGAIERLIESLESVKIVTDAFPGSEQVEQVTETKENPSE